MRILLFLLLSFNVYSQTVFIEVYFPKVNQAELLICDGNYNKAMQVYDEAFAAVKTPLAKDIFNNMVCAVLESETELAKKMLLKLARKGVSSDLISEKEVTKLSKMADLWNNFRPIYEQVSSTVVMNNSNEYLEELQSFTKERFLQITEHRKTITEFSVLKEGKTVSDSTRELMKNDLENKVDSLLKTINEKINKSLKSILKTYGILSEEVSLIGGNRSFETIFYGYLDWNTNSNYDNVISKDPDYVEPFVYAGIKKGILSPVSAMRLLKRNGKYRKYQPSIFTISVDNDSSCVLLNKMKYDNLLFCKVPDFEDFTKEQYADFCNKYALPSLSDRATKVVYASIKNKYFYFTESIFPEQAVVPTCDMALERIKNATVIENGLEP